MPKKFNSIAKVIRQAREVAGISQVELSKQIGYENGQFISNVERGLCSVPAAKVVKLTEILNISSKSITDAMTEDFQANLHQVVNHGKR